MRQKFIKKCGSFFITKREQNVLQNASMLLKNAASITKCIDFITEHGRYCKTRRLLQNAA